MKDTNICKCGHDREEHNRPESWGVEVEEDTYCFHNDCDCLKYEKEASR